MIRRNEIENFFKTELSTYSASVHVEFLISKRYKLAKKFYAGFWFIKGALELYLAC